MLLHFLLFIFSSLTDTVLFRIQFFVFNGQFTLHIISFADMEYFSFAEMGNANKDSFQSLMHV